MVSEDIFLEKKNKSGLQKSCGGIFQIIFLNMNIDVVENTIEMLVFIG